MNKSITRYFIIITPIIIVFIFLTGTELFLRKLYGIPQLEPDPPQFKYQYVDIYKRFFEKVRKGSRVFYKSCPERAVYGDFREFPAVKKPGTLRLVLIGGSVAASFPLSDFFNPLFPDRNIEIINCGMGAYDSYRDYLVAKEIVLYAPDLVIVLSGNNENYTRYKINLPIYYANKFFRKFWIYRKLQERVIKEGENQQNNFSKIRETRYRNYRKNIVALVRLLNSKKIPVVLCTLPGNIKDCPPGGAPPLDKQFILSSFLLENKDYSGAVRGFQEFLRRESVNAYGLYFLGRAYEGIKDYSMAKKCYLKTWDLGFTDGGAGETSNKIIRQICREEKVLLADFEKLFMQVSPFGLCGRNLLYDYCHLHEKAYSLFTRCIVQSIFENKKVWQRLFGKTREIPKSLGKIEEQYDYLQDGNIKQMIKTSIWKIFEDRINKITSNQIDYLYDERSISYLETLYLMNPDVFWNLRFQKKDIIDDFCKNPWIKEFFIKYKPYSEELWIRLLCYMGETYRRLRQYDKALSLFDEVISMAKSDYRAYLGKGLVYYGLGMQQKVQESFNQAEEVAGHHDQNVIIKYYKEILNNQL